MVGTLYAAVNEAGNSQVGFLITFGGDLPAVKNVVYTVAPTIPNPYAWFAAFYDVEVKVFLKAVEEEPFRFYVDLKGSIKEGVVADLMGECRIGGNGGPRFNQSLAQISYSGDKFSYQIPGTKTYCGLPKGLEAKYDSSTFRISLSKRIL